MRLDKTILSIIAGTVIVTLIRRAYPEQDAAFLEMIDGNIVIIIGCFLVFVCYCVYLLKKRRVSKF